jgi:hypothetical protein
MNTIQSSTLLSSIMKKATHCALLCVCLQLVVQNIDKLLTDVVSAVYNYFYYYYYYWC